MSSETTTSTQSGSQPYNLRARDSLPKKKTKPKRVVKQAVRAEPGPPKPKKARIGTVAGRRFVLFLCNDKAGRFLVVKVPSSTISTEDLAAFYEGRKNRIVADRSIQELKIMREVTNAARHDDHSPPPKSWETYEVHPASGIGWVLEDGEVAELVITLKLTFS